MVACWRIRPWIRFALAWVMLQLTLLHLFLTCIDIANDRQMYLAGWPLSFALCIELSLWMDGARTKNIAALLYQLLCLPALIILRNQDYAREIRLWENTVMKSPGKARVHNNLGYVYLIARSNDEARSEIMNAL